MSVADMEKVLRKIRALHRMTEDRGATEAEAANAAAAAQRLLEEHRLDASLLDAGESDAERAEPVIEHDEPLDALKSKVAWRGVLVGGIARANGCLVYWSTMGPRGARVSCLQVIGTAARASAVRYLYAWLSREVDRLGADAARGRGRRYGTAFRVGCAERLAARISAEADAARRDVAARARAAATPGTGIVRVDDALARLAQEETEAKRVFSEKEVRRARSIRIGDASGYVAGRAAGDSVRLSSGPALGAGSEALRG